MEKKIIIGMSIVGLLLLIAIGGMILVLITREPVVKVEEKELLEVIEEVIEPPPLEEEALIEAMKIVGERLRVYDVEERQDAMVLAIEKEIEPGMSNLEKEQVIRDVARRELTVWKDQVIRDTLIELHGEYSSEDYSAIDRKTNIKQLTEFVSRFEMEVLGIK